MKGKYRPATASKGPVPPRPVPEAVTGKAPSLAGSSGPPRLSVLDRLAELEERSGILEAQQNAHNQRLIVAEIELGLQPLGSEVPA